MTTEKQVARCSIYENRPELCVVYPKVDHYMPPECTFTYIGSEREGKCECNIGACCAVPREDGEPGGAPMPDVAGGKPCKYLVWENVMEQEQKKEASAKAPDASGLLRLVEGEEWIGKTS